MKREKVIWIGLASAGSVSAVLGVLLKIVMTSSIIPLLAMAVTAVCFGVNLAYQLRYAKRIQTIAHTITMGSQVKITADYPRDSILHELGTASERFVEDTNQKVKLLQTENSDISLQLQLLQRRKTSVESVLNSIRDAVLVTDDRDRLLLANESAQRIFKFQFDPEASHPAEEVISANELVGMISKSRTSKIPHVRHELTIEDTENPASFDVVLSCVEDDNGRVLQVVTVLHDVTREKEISQMKNDFVSHVSHELKTPLASINAYAEMLVDGEAEDTEMIQQFCGVIQGQAQRLSRLIEDILNISRIESGLVKVSKEPHSLALVVRDAVEMISSYAQEKNIAVHSPASILYDQVNIDRDMISQVVINLLSNAVKYTPDDGEIKVDIQLNEVEGHVTVNVTDTGVGIPPEDVDHVFDKFYRVKANNKYAKGTGLGLNLVKQIVETVHGGSVHVTSTPGKGSTFGFVLPLSRETANQSA